MKNKIKNLDKFFRLAYSIPSFVEINYVSNDEVENKLGDNLAAQLRYPLIDGKLNYKFTVVYRNKTNLSVAEVSRQSPELGKLNAKYDLDVNNAFLFDSICHELIHIEQYVSGRAQLEKRNGVVNKKWMNEDITDVEYNNDPCEIEAYSNSHKLLEAFLLD